MMDYKEFLTKKCNYKEFTNVIGNILLRTNDFKRWQGEEKLDLLIKAVEEVLEEQYKEDLIYKYYYELNTIPHGHCNFERWKKGLFF